ncbi:MAG: 3-dehydroquinate synthase [Alphaproteobacteria bacterium]|nr:3-dehydroquinate synthase [Alphaproteobacteria bacterium]
MKKKSILISDTSVQFYIDVQFSEILNTYPKNNTVIITDKNVFKLHKHTFRGFKVIVIAAGEKYKQQKTVDTILESLLNFGVDRQGFIVGVGGGVITDITGYVASVYLRGIGFGFFPTSLLGMVDAAIGGKNGVDLGIYKNIIGTIKQPQFIAYDINFLKTLPQLEWINGFAEIIKHGLIANLNLIKKLEQYDLNYFKNNSEALIELIEMNIKIKTTITKADPFEKSIRKFLNFGHSFGHAIENLMHIKHGIAVSIGMVKAAHISKILLGFKEVDRIESLIKKYLLKTSIHYNIKDVLSVLIKDKKMIHNKIQYVLLEKIGKPKIEVLSLQELKKLFN